MKKSELKDLYIEDYVTSTMRKSAKQGAAKIAKAATSKNLPAGFEEHRQTEGHVTRLEQIFKNLDERPTGKKCKGMQGLVEGGKEMIDEQNGETQA